MYKMFDETIYEFILRNIAWKTDYKKHIKSSRQRKIIVLIYYIYGQKHRVCRNLYNLYNTKQFYSLTPTIQL